MRRAPGRKSGTELSMRSTDCILSTPQLLCVCRTLMIRQITSVLSFVGCFFGYSAHIPKPMRTVTLLALKPLVTGLAADVKLLASPCHCDGGLLNVLNGHHAHFATAFGFPCHSVIIPHFSQKCNLRDDTFLQPISWRGSNYAMKKTWLHHK